MLTMISIEGMVAPFTLPKRRLRRPKLAAIAHLVE
jgi:hypothetical protein